VKKPLPAKLDAGSHGVSGNTVVVEHALEVGRLQVVEFDQRLFLECR
jgi:hypothetical protein